MAKFSVIIPLYNKAPNIKDTMHSVLSQSFSDFELIIIDDGSTDNSLEVAQSVDDSRIIIFSKANEGVSKTRNFGVTKANTDHITFLDADDIWYTNHLETLHRLITKYPNHKWYATAYEKKHHKDLTVAVRTQLEPLFEGDVDDFFKHSMGDSLAWTSAVCMKTDFFNTLKGFDTTITHGAGEDTDLWIKAALVSPLVFSNMITAQYNLEGVNRVSHTNTKERTFINLDQYEAAAKNNLQLKRYLDLNRYGICIKYKLIGDTKTANTYYKKISPDSLNKKQRFLLKSNRYVLVLFLNFQSLLRKFNINLSTFK